MLKKICLILLAITVFVVILIPDKNAIPRGAQSIGAWYYKNGDDVYFEKGWGFFLQLHDPYETYRIDEADGKTFSYLGDNFAKDKNHVYFASRIIKWANPDKFKFASGSFSQYVMDDKNVWYNRKIILWADPKTFELLRPTGRFTAYSKDKNYVYLNWDKIDIDIKTFKVVEWQTDEIRFLRDQYGVYCFEWKKEWYDKLQLNWINLNTFELLNKEYSRDDKHVYFANCTYQWFYFKIVEWADPKTFQIK